MLQFIHGDYLLGCPNHSKKKKAYLKRTEEEEALQHAAWLPKSMQPLVKRLENDLHEVEEITRGSKRQAAIAAEGRIKSVMAAAARIVDGEGLQPNADEARWQAQV